MVGKNLTQIYIQEILKLYNSKAQSRLWKQKTRIVYARGNKKMPTNKEEGRGKLGDMLKVQLCIQYR